MTIPVRWLLAVGCLLLSCGGPPPPTAPEPHGKRHAASPCPLGGGAACRLAADKLAKGPDDKRHPRYCSLLNSGCLAGDEAACDRLRAECFDSFSRAYMNRDRLDQAERACEVVEDPSPQSCREAGALHEGATGIPPSPNRAVEYYDRGCYHGDLVSCLRQAQLVANPVEAAKVLGAACAKPLAGACLALGRAHLAGKAVTRHRGRAAASFASACEQGEAEGCLEAARLLRGDGAATTTALAAAFRRACSKGSLDACRDGARLAGLSAGDRAYFSSQACFRRDEAACPGAPGTLAVAVRTVDLSTSSDPIYGGMELAFVGPGGEGLLASHVSQLTLIDPATGKVAATTSLASEIVAHPRPRESGLHRSVHGGAWGWDRKGLGLVGLVSIGGNGVPPEESGRALWAPAKEPPRRVKEAKDSRVAAISFELGIAALGHDAGLQLLDLHSGELRALEVREVEKNHDLGGISGVDFSIKGDRLAFSRWKGAVYLVTLTDRPTVTPLRGGPRDLYHLALHPTKPKLLAGDSDRRIFVWDLDKPEQTPRPVPLASWTFRFSPDGRFLVAVLDDELVIMDGDTFERVARPIPLRGGLGGGLAFSRDARYLAVADRQGVTIIDFAPGQPAATIDTGWFGRLERLPPPPLPKGPPISERGTISGKVLLDEQPLANAEVTLSPDDNEWPEARALAVRRTRTGRDGSFRFAKVPAIDWDVAVRSPQATRDQTDANLRWHKFDKRALDSKVTLEVHPAFVVSGVVLGPDGRPAPGARIGAFPDEIITDRKGRFQIPHQPPGPVTVRASDAAGAAGMASLVAGDGKPVELKLAPPDDPRVLRVRVVDEAAPIARIRVSSNDEVAGATDNRGELSIFIDGPRARISVWDGSHRSAERSIRMPHPETLVLDPSKQDD